VRSKFEAARGFRLRSTCGVLGTGLRMVEDISFAARSNRIS